MSVIFSIFGAKSLRWVVANRILIGGLFTAIVGFFTFIIKVIESQIPSIIEKLESIADTDFPTVEIASITNFLSLLNAIMPLTEALLIYASLYTFWGVILSVRWIKSFIPTLSN